LPNQQFFRWLHAAGMRSTARETPAARNSRPSRSEQQPREHADKQQDQQHRPNTPAATPDGTPRCSTDRWESHVLIVIIEAGDRKITGLDDFDPAYAASTLAMKSHHCPPRRQASEAEGDAGCAVVICDATYTVWRAFAPPPPITSE
jgi:hypothetical protein